MTIANGHLILQRTISQKTYPGVGDIDDCTQLALLMGVRACAPWLPLASIAELRAAAGDPDDGVRDGGDAQQLESWKALSTLYPELVRAGAQRIVGWKWDAVLAELKKLRPLSVSISSAKLPPELRFGFTGLHQVLYFHEPGEGLHIANPLAPDRSYPPRIHTADARAAAEAFGGGLVNGILFPSQAEAFRQHPLYEAPAPVDCTAAVKAATDSLTKRLATANGRIRDAAIRLGATPGADI